MQRQNAKKHISLVLVLFFSLVWTSSHAFSFFGDSKHDQTSSELTLAEKSLKNHQPQEALTQLYRIQTRTLPQHLQRRYYQLLAHTYTALHNTLESVRALIELDRWLTSSEEKEANQTRIWQAVMRLSPQALKTLNPNRRHDPLSAWMSLALLTKKNQSQPIELQAAVMTWQKRYPHIQTLETLPKTLLSTLAQVPEYPKQIAVLLPLNGSFSNAATQIQSGLLKAYYQTNPFQRPSITFYDTHSGKEAKTAYLRAVKEGADFIIGPLSKQGVKTISSMRTPVKTLLLNRFPEDERAQRLLYSLALSPENEAQQIANRAWADGFRQALLLTAQSAWGQRLNQAFTQRWNTLGGKILHQAHYTTPRQVNPALKKLLQVPASLQRTQSLQALLGVTLQSQAKPTDAADFIFFTGTANAARQIKPLLRFYFSSHLPVYTTQRVISAEQHALSPDLNGLRILTAPWLLSSNASEQPRDLLYALGIDAYRVSTTLNRFQHIEGYQLQGVTGVLQANKRHQILPQLEWVTIKKGRATALLQ